MRLFYTRNVLEVKVFFCEYYAMFAGTRFPQFCDILWKSAVTRPLLKRDLLFCLLHGVCIGTLLPQRIGR